MKRVDVAIAIIFNDSEDHVLMVRNKSGDSSYWSLPGGAVEAGETLEEAAKREVKEESGFDIEIEELHSVREVYFTERGHHALLFTFLSNIIGGEINISDPDNEILEVKWVDLQTANDWMTYLPEPIKPIKKDAEKSRFPGYYFQGAF